MLISSIILWAPGASHGLAMPFSKVEKNQVQHVTEGQHVNFAVAWLNLNLSSGPPNRGVRSIPSTL